MKKLITVYRCLYYFASLDLIKYFAGWKGINIYTFCLWGLSRGVGKLTKKIRPAQ